MEKVIIESATMRAVTNVPFDVIMRLIEEHIGEMKERKMPAIVRYIRDKYPKFYKPANDMGLLDDGFVGGIQMLAEDTGRTAQEMVDTLLSELDEDNGNIVKGTIIAAIIANARSRWIKKNAE